MRARARARIASACVTRVSRARIASAYRERVRDARVRRKGRAGQEMYVYNLPSALLFSDPFNHLEIFNPITNKIIIKIYGPGTLRLSLICNDI